MSHRLVALVLSMPLLGATGLASVSGCDDAAAALAGTGGMKGTGTAGMSGAGTGGMSGAGTGGTPGIGIGGNAGGPSGCSDGSGAALGLAAHPGEGAAHIEVCSAVAYHTVPPSSGAHYPVWPAYKTYAEPVPWGFLVHGLEHGAIEVVYNCPGGCAGEVASVQAWIDGLLPDPGCAGARPRVILAPDPTLDVRWAASAWTWTLRACVFDQAMFQQFFDDHYNQAPELNICVDGADYSSTGWCP